jgi:hypothetical protein
MYVYRANEIFRNIYLWRHCHNRYNIPSSTFAERLLAQSTPIKLDVLLKYITNKLFPNASSNVTSESVVIKNAFDLVNVTMFERHNEEYMKKLIDECNFIADCIFSNLIVESINEYKNS